jgi:ABC-type transport system involved in cytochrome c biogenesis permease subunit
MNSETMAAIAAAACFLVAALACSRGEEAGSWLGIAGAAFLATSLVARGWRERVWPFHTSYEFSQSFALATALSALLVGRKQERLAPLPQISAIRAAAMAMAASLIVYARLAIPAASRDVQPLPLTSSSVLCMLHAGTAAMGYGALAVAGLAGAVYLRQDPGPGSAESSGDAAAAGTSEGQNTLWMLDRMMLLGYPLLTLSLLLRMYCIRGALWTRTFWTSSWSSNPQAIALLLTWVLYTAYWPLRGMVSIRRRAKWRIQSTAWLATIGLGCLLFTFIGVNWLVRGTGAQSQHPF